MIVRPRLSWLRMLFVIRGSVLPKIWVQLLVIAALATAVTWTHGDLLGWRVGLTYVPFTSIGVALAIFLGFRNTASYERYWEARKLWGAMLNASRSLTRQYIVWLGDREPAADFVHRLIGFVHALRHQLRGSDPLPDLSSLVDASLLASLQAARSRPALILQSLGRSLAEAAKRQDLHPQIAAVMEQSMMALTDVLGGCERIANTPIPFAYSVIVHRTVYIYCFLLPFGLISSIGLLTPLMVTFVAYTFLALDALNEELEDPFGAMPNDLPLLALSTGIEITLRELLGEDALPEATPSEDFVLP
ncbi:bestrophin family protein [Acidithiobacillus sp.]|uniref:bestrophin family protein n=1 Tax=Acidithiobacillus sp. TaxID=1872118 RepID=UPI0025BFFDBF|nr:bestrophin family ion channel [Acidithiobacillus sp.]